MTETENKAREVVENGADTSEDAPPTANSAAAVCSSEASSSVAAVPDKMVLLEKYKETLVYLCNFQNEYSSRVDSLLDSWKYITQILQQSTPDASENLFHWVLKYTVQLILVGDWVNIDQEKRDLIQHKIESILPQLQPGSMSRYRCDYILKNIGNPWGNEDLLKVLRGDPWTVTDEDMEYLTQERGFMILLRLQKLCEIKCDEMAFVWSSKALTAYRSVDSEHVLRKSTSLKQFSFLLDVYLCHLHKYGHISHIIDEVKQLDLDSAQQLIHRNVNPNAEISRLGKYRKRVARLASDIVIAKLMVEELTDKNEKYYCDILKEWLCIHKTVPVDEFRNNARKLYLTAISRKHLYVACDVIKQMDKDDFRELLLELCVRAITGELNELELLKSEKSCDEHIVIQHEVDLSYRYIYLADLLKNHPPLAQECILTAFSLNPTKENYQLVRDIAMRKQTEEHTLTGSNKPTSEPSSSVAITSSSSSQEQPVDKEIKRLSNQLSEDVTITKVVNSSSSSAALSSPQQTQSDKTLEEVTITTAVTLTKPPISEITTGESLKVKAGDMNLRNLAVTPGPSKGHKHRTSIDVLHSITGSSKIFESPSYDALAAPSSIFDSLETVEIPNHLRSDLSVLLSNPRLKILSWMLPWPELDTHCQKLLKEDCKLSIVRQSLAGANDKLQYLHLDYNMFRHLPESECPGIEKGYEQYSMDPDDLAGLMLKRKKSKKSKKSSKERKEKIEKPPKSTKDRKDQKVVKKSRKPSSAPTSQALQPAAGTAAVCPLAAQRAREYEELLRRALYIQQLQHQLQLSQSLSMLNQHTPVNRNFFLPYLAAQMQDKNKNDKPAIAAPPTTVPLQKVTKISKIVKKSSPKPSGSSMPPPLQLTLPPRPSNSKGQSEQTRFLLQPVQRMQQGQDVQVVQQMQSVQQQQHSPPQLKIISSSTSVQKIVSNSQQQPATATVQQTQNKPVLVQPVLIKDNNTLVKLAILKNITQKMLLQRQQQQQQQQMQQHVQQQQQQLQSSPSSSGSSTPTALPPRLMTHPPALQLSQTNVILNPLNTFHNDQHFGIIRNIPTSTITSIQTSIARCNLPVETTVPAPMKMSSVIKPNAQISVQPNSGKNIYTCSPLGTVTTVVKIAQTKPTISKATIAKTAAETTTVKSVKVKSFPVKADSVTKKTTTESPKVIPALTPSAKASTTKSKVVKSSSVKIKVNPVGLTLLPAESFSGILRKFEGHSSTAPPLSVILPAPVPQLQKERVAPQDSSSTESAPESLKYNLNLYATNEKKIVKKLSSPQSGSLKKKPKKPKEVKPKEPKTPKEPKKSKEPKVPKEPKSSKLMKIPKEPKMLKGKILSPSKSPKVQRMQKSEKVKRAKTPKSQSPSTSASSETVSKFLNLNVQQDVAVPSVTLAAEKITSPGSEIIQAAGTIPLPLEEARKAPAPQEEIVKEMAGDTLELVPISASREIEQYIIKIREGLVDDSTKDVTSQDEENNEIIDMLLDMEENKELTKKTASPNTKTIHNESPPLPKKLDDFETAPAVQEINEIAGILDAVPEVASTITVVTTKEQNEEIVGPDPEIFTDVTRKNLSSPMYSEINENGANIHCALEEEEPCSSSPAENIILNKEKNNSSEDDSPVVKSKEIFTEDFLDHVSREWNSPIPPALQDDYDVFPIQIPEILNTTFRSDAEEDTEKYPLNVRPDEINPSIDLPAEERCSQVMHTIFHRQSKSQVEPNEEIAQIFSNSVKREKRDPRIYLRRLQPSDYENDDPPENSGRGSKSRTKDGKVPKAPVNKLDEKDTKSSAVVPPKRGRGRPPKNKNFPKKSANVCFTENEGSDLEVEAILSTKQEPRENGASERSIRPKTAMLRAYYAKKAMPSAPKRPKSSVPSGRPRGRPRKNPLPPPKPPARGRKSEAAPSRVSVPARARTLTSARTSGLAPFSARVRAPERAPKRPSSVITLSSDSESELTLIQMKLNGLRKARENCAALQTAPVPVVIFQDPVKPRMRKKSLGRCTSFAFTHRSASALKENKKKKISRQNVSRGRRTKQRSGTDDSDDSYRPNSRPRPRGRSRRRRRSTARPVGYRSDNEFNRRSQSRSNSCHPRCKSVMHGGPGSSRRRTFHCDSDSWMDQNVPILSPRRRSGRSRSHSTQRDCFSYYSSWESSVNSEIELLHSIGVKKGPGPRRLRRTSTLNVSYYDQESSDDEPHYYRGKRCDTPRFYKTPAKRKKKSQGSNFNVPKDALSDPKLYLQTPIVELTRFSGRRRNNTNSPFTTDSETQIEWKSSKSSQQPKRIKKIYLKNIRSSQIAIVNESSCSSPRTEPEHLRRLSEPKKRGRKPKSFQQQGQKQGLSKISSSKIRHQGQSVADMPRQGRPRKREEAPKRAVSMPLAARDRSQISRRIIRHPGKMELRLDKLDNRTMLKYRQSILVNGVLVSSPVIALKRLKINRLPVRLSSNEFQEEVNRRPKPWGPHRLRKTFPPHIRKTIREELLDKCGLLTNRNPYSRFINLTDYAELPHEQWNNLDMFQVSSDEDSILEQTEMRRPPKIPRIENKLTKNCNMTKEAVTKDRQPSPREFTPQLGNKKNFMYDIYSVIVKPDFLDSPPSSLFSCNMKKENVSKTAPATSPTTANASDLFLSIAAKFLIKSLSVTEEKQHLVYEMMSDKKDFWFPDILGRRILEQEITEILCGVRNILKESISAIVPNKRFRLVNETLDESKTDYYLNKKLINALPAPPKGDSFKKWTDKFDTPAYNELRNLIYRRTLGEKFNNKTIEFGELFGSKPEDKINENRILFKVPGFRTLEYFSAPSYHCLPVVRIVHSTLPLEEKTESEPEPSSSEVSGEVPNNSTTSQNVTVAGEGQKATLVPVVHKTFGTPQTEGATGNVRVIIPQGSGPKKGPPSIHYTGAIKTTATLIKVDKKEVQERISKIEPNFVLLGCGNNSKFVPIKKDDRILLASSTRGVHEGRADEETPRGTIQQCRLIETSTLKTAPKVSLSSGSSSSSTTTTTILPVQFIYKSDGGMIHFTPVSGVTGLQNLNVGKELKTISLVKAETTKTGHCIETGTTSHLSVINTRSLYEENYAKFIQTSSASQENSTAVIQAFVQQTVDPSPPSLSSTALNSSLPKFTQAFGGKTIYIEGMDEGLAKKDQNKGPPGHPGNFIMSKQNVTISRPIICSVAESFTKNKITSTVPSARIVSGTKQQLKIIQTGETGVATTTTTTAIGQRTTLLSPLPISVPIVSQSAISSYVQTRYMRPFLHISQGNLQGGCATQGAQQVVVTTSSQAASSNTPISTATTKIKCLPTLTVTKRERPGKSLDEKKIIKKEEHVDNSTLEQLREFDLVLEQVKERSTTSSNQPLKTEGTDAMSQTETAPARKCAIKIEKESLSHGTSSLMNLKLIQKTPFIVVGNSLTAHARVFTSPTKSVCVEKPRPEEMHSTQATQTKQTVVKNSIMPVAKLKTPQKPISVGGTAVISPAAAAAAAYTQKISKPQEDEQTVQRIYDILAEYAEQLRNSPDLNNKPAPRRRSNPLNSCTANGKKRKTLIQKPSDSSLASTDLDQTMDSEDSSCGTSSIYNRSPLHDSSTSIDSSNNFMSRHQQHQQQQTSSVKSETEGGVIAIVDASKKVQNSASGQSSKISITQQQSVNVINFDLANQSQGNRTTAVLVPGKYLFPLNAIKSGELLETKETIKKFGTTSGQSQVVYKTRPVKIADTLTHQKGGFKPITVTQNSCHPAGVFSSAQRKPIESNCAENKIEGGISKTSIVFQTQPGGESSANFTTAMQRNNLKIISVQQPSAAEVQGTSVITKISEKELIPNSQQLHLPLSTTMLAKIHQNGEILKKQTSDKIRNNLRLDSGQNTSSKILKQLNEGRKLALERELKFHKSLSDECEDLGVDEPSASDLFPEADLLFDPTSSAFETNSQDDEVPRDLNAKTPPKGQGAGGATNGDFSGSSSILRTTSLREVIGWDSAESTGAIIKNSNNFIIHHTSGDPFRKSPPWSPAKELFNLGFKNSGSGEEEDEAADGEGASVAATTAASRKRRLSSRGPAARKGNCPCYTPPPGAVTTAAIPATATVLNSSTQTLGTPMNGPSGAARSGRLISPSQIAEHFAATKRIRTVKVSPVGAEGLQLKIHRLQKAAEPQKEAPVAQGQQAALTAPVRRTLAGARLTKVSRR